MWRNYSGWLRDAKTSYERELGRTRASLSASGVKVGSDAWTQELQRVESDYQSELKEIRGGATARTLKEFSRTLRPDVQYSIDPETGDRKREPVEDRFAMTGRSEFSKRFGEEFSTERWEERVAGRYGFGKRKIGDSPGDQAAERAKEAAGGRRPRVSGGKRKSPWMGTTDEEDQFGPFGG